MNKPTRISLLATELRKMGSTITGESYKISIALPYTYDKPMKMTPFDKPPAASWPVVYLLDPDWFFGAVTDSVRYMAWCSRTTDAIVVGIGKPEQESPGETVRKGMAWRTHALTPVHSEKSDQYNSEWLHMDVKTGGGREFLTFIKQELMPTIEREYRADPARRILAGHSHGGLLALFAMFQEPGLFAGHVVSSPSLDFAGGFMVDLECEYAKTHKKLPTRLYLSAGELEVGEDDTTLTDMYRFAAILESHNYRGFHLTKQVFPDCNHCEVAPAALQAGLKMMLTV